MTTDRPLEDLIREARAMRARTLRSLMTAGWSALSARFHAKRRVRWNVMVVIGGPRHAH